MNSQQRRTLKREVQRSLRELGVILTESQQSIPKKGRRTQGPKTRQGLSKLLKTAIAAHSRLWKILLAIAGILGVGVLGLWPPKISIEPYASRDPRNPFKQQFSVQNTNLYALRNVQPRCAIRKVSNEFNSELSGFSLAEADEFVHSLAPSAKTNATCRIGEFTKDLEISIAADYDLPLPFRVHRCWAADFKGQSASDHTWIWTYQGASDCADQPN